MIDVVKPPWGTWYLPLFWKHGSELKGLDFSWKNVWAMFDECAKCKRTWWTHEIKPWTWEQHKIIQFMNIAIRQKQVKIVTMIHSCVFWSNGNLFLGNWESVFLGNLIYIKICFSEKNHLGKLSLCGIVSPICSPKNSTPSIFKGGPHIILAQGFLF
jgi:hypothetical protein